MIGFSTMTHDITLTLEPDFRASWYSVRATRLSPWSSVPGQFFTNRHTDVTARAPDPVANLEQTPQWLDMTLNPRATGLL